MRRDLRVASFAGTRRLLNVAATLTASALLGGCVFVASSGVSPPNPAPEPVVAAPEAPPPVPAPPPAPAPKPEPEPTRTAIVLTQEIPAFADVADELLRRLDSEHVTVHDLGGRPAEAGRVLAELKAANPDRVVAIGLLAATVAKELEGTPVVFAQVYNYTDNDLISPHSKGVSFLPPFDRQLETWRALSPTLRHVGVITGPGQEGLVDEIRRAAGDEGLELSVRTAQTDQEALFNFKRLTTEIQGLWLLPDNRILSPTVVREIMSYAAKHRIQVVVFGRNLLGLGALMSIEASHADVAERVLERFEAVSENGDLRGPDMLPLTDMRVRVNQEVARHLDLVVPEQLASSRASN